MTEASWEEKWLLSKTMCTVDQKNKAKDQLVKLSMKSEKD